MNLSVSHIPRAVVIFIALVALFVTGFGIYYHHTVTQAASQQAAAARAAAARKAHDEALAKANAEAAAERKKAEQAAAMNRVDHVVHKGQGPIHVLTRILVADPSIMDGFPGQFTGDRNDPKAIKRWGDHEAAALAIYSGMIGKFGEEYRIKLPDTVAVDIVKDPVSGRLKVVEYAASTLVAKATSAGTTDTTAKVDPPTSAAPINFVDAGGQTFSQVAAFSVATTMATTHVPFTTKPDGTIVFSSPFAYIYDGTPENG